MTTAELSSVYGISRRTAQNDCLARIYPHTRRCAGKSNKPEYKIQPYIPMYPRQTWLHIKTLRADKLTEQEQEAYILAYGHQLSIKAIASYLQIKPADVRRIYDNLYSTGKLATVYSNLGGDTP